MLIVGYSPPSVDDFGGTSHREESIHLELKSSSFQQCFYTNISSKYVRNFFCFRVPFGACLRHFRYKNPCDFSFHEEALTSSFVEK